MHSNYEITFLDENDITFFEQIGKGKFSIVYRAALPNGTIVAAKKLFPNDFWRLQREVHLMDISAHFPNTDLLYGVYGNEENPIIVKEYSPPNDSRLKTLADLKWVMRSLLETLSAAHRENLFHRDVKLQNLLVDYENRQIKLIDWGLADFYIENTRYNPRVGTKSYKAPELLFEYPYFNKKIDTWAAGIVAANLMFGVPALFSAPDNNAVLRRHNDFFGSDKMRELAREYKSFEKFLDSNPEELLEFALPHTRKLITRDGIDFISSLLQAEIDARATADQALAHPFLNCV